MRSLVSLVLWFFIFSAFFYRVWALLRSLAECSMPAKITAASRESTLEEGCHVA